MPLALFLISVLVSSSMFLSTSRVYQDSFVQQSLLASTAAFYTASSSAEVSWTEVTPENATEVVEAFVGERTDDGVTGSQEYLDRAFDADDQESVELNRGIALAAVNTQVEVDFESYVESYYQSSGEVFLYEVPVDLAIDDIQVDYCLSGPPAEPCSELFVEWFVLDSDFDFQDLGNLKRQEEVADIAELSGTSAFYTYFEPCLDYPSIGIERCVLRVVNGNSGESRGDLTVAPATADSRYQRSFALSTLGLKNAAPNHQHYLLRFRARDKKPFTFQITGRQAGKQAPLPTAFFQIDETGRARNSFRRIQQQQSVSGGLQDGLEFAHFAETVGTQK